MNEKEIQEALRLHKMWLYGEEGGKRFILLDEPTTGYLMALLMPTLAVMALDLKKDQIGNGDD